ncbi:MAG: hypothetical protein ACI35O_17035 [Bacillaceae bacterium]
MKKLFGVSDGIMLANLQAPIIETKLNGDGKSIENGFSLHNVFLFSAISTAIILVIAGIIQGRKYKTEEANFLYVNGVFSLLYGIIMAVFSLFAGISYKEKVEGVSAVLSVSYPFFGTLITTFFLAFLFHGVGYLFSINFRKSTGHLVHMIPYGEAIHQAFATVIRGSIFVFVSLFAYVVIKLNDFKDVLSFFTPFRSVMETFKDSILYIASIVLQISQYIFGLLHFGKVGFTTGRNTELGTIEYGLLSGFSLKGEAVRNQAFFNGINMSTFNLYLWLGVLILLLLFLWSGYRIAQQGENVVQHVLIFSLCYGVFMAMLSVVTKFSFETIESGVGTTSNVVFSIGLGPISMFIRATILAGVVAYGGTWIAKMRERQNK